MTELPDEVKPLVDRFLAWPLPKSVRSDACVTDSNYELPRSGTNLLTADEARQMIEYLLAPSAAENTERRLQKLEQLGFADAAAHARQQGLHSHSPSSKNRHRPNPRSTGHED